MAPMSFDDLVAHFVTVQRAANALGYSRQSLYDWRARGIPERRQLEIAQRTKGALKADRAIVNKYRALLRAA